MNLLIAGGLLIIGVLLIVALVFVIRGEPATKESASVPPPAPIKQETSENRAEAEKFPSSVQVPSAPNMNATPFSQVPPTPNINATPSLSEQRTSEWQPLANGQFYELKNELQSLHGQAQELEYRIRGLVDMFERVEHTQNGRFPIEEQSSDSSGTQAIR